MRLLPARATGFEQARIGGVAERMDPEEQIGRWLHRHDGRLGHYRAVELTRPAEILRELESAIALLSVSYEELRVRRERVGAVTAQLESARDPWTNDDDSRLSFELAARRAADNQRQRDQFLVAAARSLLRTRGVAATYETVVELAVPGLGSYALLDAVREEGGMQRVAVHHADVLARATLRGTIGYPVVDGDPNGVSRAAETGLSCVVERAGAGAAAASYPCSFELVVPLVVDDEVLGVLTVGRDAPAPKEVDPLAQAEAFADLAAVAIREARTFDRVVAAAHDAERANTEKLRFLSVLSHEIRTPLSSALGYVELLLAGIPVPLDDGHKAYAEGIHMSIHHQLGIVDQILQYARIDTRMMPVRNEPVSIACTLRDVADIIRPAVAGAGLDLDLAIPPDDVLLSTDAGMLRQALLNIANNAVRFTGTGRIRLSADATDDRVLVCVEDTGPGIPSDEVEHIFDAFWRGSESAALAPAGMGLGLSITRELVSRLGGTIEVRTEAGSGAEFRILLPPTHVERQGPASQRAMP
jgi:signal transduction histidine kinase